MALQLNAAYGLNIDAWPQPCVVDMAPNWCNPGEGSRECAQLIIGCVDNLGRCEIAWTVTAFDGQLWAIDCGNEQHSGQIEIGNLTNMSQMKVDSLGLCSGLPSPYLQEPDMLTPDPNAQVPSCAKMALAETQSLMVNRMAATIAAQYTAVSVLQRQILQIGTVFTPDPPTARSRLLTCTNLAKF